MTGRQKERERMVRIQIAGRGVTDARVLSAMRSVERGNFVPAHEADLAYADRPLPIGAGQTISQPYVVALMVEVMQLEGGEKVLEVGAGSGYAAAVLSRIAHEVFAIERIESLAAMAKANLARGGYGNVHVRHSDGTRGWPEEAPFDAILVSAGAPALPDALKGQLTIGGRLVIPVGDEPHRQTLIRLTRTGPEAYLQENLGEVRFVPLIGAQGWSDAAENPPDKANEGD
ncbi:MAG: protein-L-isoaspartate(D-aspartate) O-methyltransferase [Hyphomicrobiaceae bacterium]